MSDASETTLWILIGTLVTAVIAGISFLCRKRCRNQTCDIDSGCCKFHSDSSLRRTIREEIARSFEARDTESQVNIPTD